jgi:hypothetical protein
MQPRITPNKIICITLLLLLTALFFTILYGRTSYEIVEISIKNSN